MYPNFNQVYIILRQLSRTNYWQSIYCQSKECSGIQLFKNNSDYTHFQLIFLNEISKFSSVCMDVAMGEVSELVLSEEIYQDAYLFYKQHKRIKKNKKTKHGPNLPSTTTDNQYHKKEILNQNQWVFTKVKGEK